MAESRGRAAASCAAGRRNGLESSALLFQPDLRALLQKFRLWAVPGASAVEPVPKSRWQSLLFQGPELERDKGRGMKLHRAALERTRVYAERTEYGSLRPARCPLPGSPETCSLSPSSSPETCSLVPSLGFHAPALDGCIQPQNQQTEPSSQAKARRALS